jgi:hypothetical protein
MTPARRKTLTDAVDLIASASNKDQLGDDPQTFRTALIRLGARFVDGHTNTMRLAGVSASCAWDNGEHLLLRWAANARTALAEATDETGNTEEEE